MVEFGVVDGHLVDLGQPAARILVQERHDTSSNRDEGKKKPDVVLEPKTMHVLRREGAHARRKKAKSEPNAFVWLRLASSWDS